VKRLLVLAALIVLPGCKCKPAPVDPPARGPQPTEAWLKGELPPEANQGTPVSGGTLTVRVPSEPAGLNRLHDQMIDATMVRYLMGPVYETLAEVDRAALPENGQTPLLATSWEESADHLTLTVHLRKGVTFHDGGPFTSRDVRATVEAVRNVKNQTASLRSQFVDLASLSTPDDFTVVARWSKPYAYALHNFLTSLPMMSAASLQGDFDTLPVNRAPIGTGPFRFESWETGQKLTFVRAPQYWGTPAYLDRLVMRVVKDDTVATQLWEQGEFDLMTRIQPGVWRAIEAPVGANAWAIEGYHRISFLENNYSWIGWNEERPFFKDARVRRALAMLYPAAEVARHVDLGIELPTTCPWYRLSASCDPSVTPLPYDPAGAAALLDEAGWKVREGDGVREKDGVRFRFTFLANPHSVRLAKLVPLLVTELKRVGIEMDVEKVDSAIYLSRMRTHDFDAASLAWSTNEGVRDNYQVFHSSQRDGGSNYVGYASPEVDALLEKIRLTFDPAARVELEREVHRKLYADQVYLFLTNRPALDAAKTRVRGLSASLAWYDLRKVWLAPAAGDAGH